MIYNKEHFPLIRSGHLDQMERPGRTPPPWHLSEPAIKELAELIGYLPNGQFILYAVVDTDDFVAVVILRPAVSGIGIEIVPINPL
jgi:hypothetical protein